jgi:Fe-S-cluster-containing dehydrogenase component/CRP-like cAMP-binding protein
LNEASFAQAFSTPFFRDLDARARQDLSLSSRVVECRAGESFYEEGQSADALFVVVSGEVELRAIRRGEDTVRTLRSALRGDLFGEEATVTGATRLSRAQAKTDASVVEVPFALVSRARVRGGVAEDVIAREQRSLRRALSRDALLASALGSELPDSEIALLLDAAQWQQVERGNFVYQAGETAELAYILVAGLIQLQVEDGGRTRVSAYLSRGDVLGDDAALSGERHDCSAVALGDVHLLALPRAALRSAVDRSPALLGRLRRVAQGRDDVQRDLVAGRNKNATSHVLGDLYRMHVARSLLVIDQDSCVRCGQCSSACADVHGATRLVRRGDKIVTSLQVADAPSSLLVPNSCQHCDNPACMIDCPTGAIGRDPRGEVFIRESLCTGCGACAKACPWENIRMAPRSPGAATPDHAQSAVGTSALVATKCDLCRERDGPACVSACPTGSILRLDPSRDFAEVLALFPGRAPAPSDAATPVAASRNMLRLLPSFVGLTLMGIGAGLHAGGWLSARSAPGQGFGFLSLALVLALFAYGVQKRRYRKTPKRKRGARADAKGVAPKTTRAAFRLHVWLGFAALAAVALHAGFKLPSSAHTLVGAVFWCSSLLGVLGYAAYQLLPPVLTRIERKGLLPEDFSRERSRLMDRLFRATSGKSEAIKLLVRRVLMPYARAPWGGLSLVTSGRNLREEEAQLNQRLFDVLQDKAPAHAREIEELTRTVVEIRALPVRRVLTFLLRAVLPVHVLTLGLLAVFLVVHLVAVWGRY